MKTQIQKYTNTYTLNTCIIQCIIYMSQLLKHRIGGSVRFKTKGGESTTSTRSSTEIGRSCSHIGNLLSGIWCLKSEIGYPISELSIRWLVYDIKIVVSLCWTGRSDVGCVAEWQPVKRFIVWLDYPTGWKSDILIVSEKWTEINNDKMLIDEIWDLTTFDVRSKLNCVRWCQCWTAQIRQNEVQQSLLLDD